MVLPRLLPRGAEVGSMTRRTISARVTDNPPAILSNEQLPQLLSEKQAACWLGVSVVFLRRGRSCGATGKRTPTPPFVRVGGRVYYRHSDLEVWISELTARGIV
jgi:hypothetical protein